MLLVGMADPHWIFGLGAVGLAHSAHEPPEALAGTGWRLYYATGSAAPSLDKPLSPLEDFERRAPEKGGYRA
jgi:hypothetical protein